MRTCFFIGGVCDTLGNSGFLRFSGELVFFRKLGQLDLYTTLSSLGLPVSTIYPMEPVGVGFTPEPPKS